MQRARHMRRRGLLEQVPLFLLAVGGTAASMFVPAIFALVRNDHSDARMFFYAGMLTLVVCAFVAIAVAGRKTGYGALGPLLSMLGVMVLLPVLLAIPFYEALRTTTFLNAYLEMVSAITTTGGTIFEDPDRLSPALHLWRAQVAWMGGFVMWVSAAAILAPLNLGGFEVTARSEPGREPAQQSGGMQRSARKRVMRCASDLGPIYVGLTGILWLLLVICGEVPFHALIHAMSILSTSGISATSGLEGAASGRTGEALMLLFMVFALSRLTFSTDTVTVSGQGVLSDPEIQLAAVIVTVVTLLLFARHWLGAIDVQDSDAFLTGPRALWGSFFTVGSFLTTTGFVSADWATAQGWSGLGTPGLILLGLAVIGGGVATTAGGVKLLRMFALYRHGVREMEQLIHPSSVTGARGQGRRLQRQGAFIAWVFFMLFALSLAAFCLLFSAYDASFEHAVVLTVAGLSNTGPLLLHAAETPVDLATLPSGAKAVFCAAMVIGRLEILAIIALFTPDLWRS